MRWIWIGAIAIRVIAAIGLLAYPRIADSDLTGWDAERFQEIAELSGRPWADEPVEYPPGSVVVIKAMAADDAVETNDRLIVLSLAIDVTIAFLIRQRWSLLAGSAYLGLGLPLIPAGLLRLDLWAALAAVMAIAELRRGRDLRFAAWTAVGALIKVWPALAIFAALAIRRTKAAALAASVGAISLVAWIGYAGVDGPRQVISLRGTTGWQIETIGGSLTGLLTDEAVTLQNNAYRIGTMSPSLVLLGRLATLAMIATAVVVTRRRTSRPALSATAAELVMLASTAAMIVFAPLLSPQFLLWLTPFAAMTWPSRAAIAAAVAIAITGVAGAAFGYANLADPLPAAILLLRDLVLVSVIVFAVIELRDESPVPQPLEA